MTSQSAKDALADPAQTPIAESLLTHRDIVRRLAGAQKSAKGAPAYSRFVNRPLGRQFSAIAYRFGLSPNAVTATSALFSFAAIAAIALVEPSITSGIAISAALILGYALDAADGQLARLRGGGSYAGEWLDHFVDSAKVSTLHLAVLIGLFRFSDLGSSWLLVPVGFAAVAAVSFFAMTLNDQLRRNHSAVTGDSKPAGSTSTLRALIVLPTDYGVLCVVFLAWGDLTIFFAVYSFLFACTTCYLALAAAKWFREMRKLDLERRT